MEIMHCKNCIFWKRESPTKMGICSKMTGGYEPVQDKETGVVFRAKDSDSDPFKNIPIDLDWDDFFMVLGSDVQPLTGETFGCVKHESE